MATPSLHFVVSSSYIHLLPQMDVSTAKKKATHKMVYKDGISNVMDKAFGVLWGSPTPKVYLQCIALRFSNEIIIGSLHCLEGITDGVIHFVSKM